jgi:hypothetical protein
MHSAIIIAPLDLIPAADAFAAQVGLATGQFVQPYGEAHKVCAFPPPDVALAALDGPLPEWMQVIDLDAESPPMADPAKVMVCISAALDGMALRAAVDARWPEVSLPT